MTKMRKDLLGKVPDKSDKSRKDLIGEVPVKRGRGRPRKDSIKAKDAKPASVIPFRQPIDSSDKKVEIEDVMKVNGLIRNPHSAMRGVSAKNLGIFLKATRHEVNKKLANVRPVSIENDIALYDFREGADAIIGVDRDAIIASAKISDMPQKLQSEYWLAMQNKHKVLLAAGDLWTTNQVMENGIDILETIRTELLLIPDQIEKHKGATIDQYKMFKNLIDVILQKISEAIEEKSEYKGNLVNLKEKIDDGSDIDWGVIDEE